MKDCGVFGVSSDEFLNYALENKKEWEERGQEVVQEMTEKMLRMDQRQKKSLCNEDEKESANDW